jgi:hypothetical protein
MLSSNWAGSAHEPLHQETQRRNWAPEIEVTRRASPGDHGLSPAPLTGADLRGKVVLTDF